MASLAGSTFSTSTGTNASATPPRDRRAWTYQHAQNAGTYVYPAPPDAAAQKVQESILAYVRGDHKQNGAAWKGAGYPIDGSPIPSATLARILRMHTSVPEAFACVERRVDGACGHQADIDILPTDPQGEEQEDGTRGLSKAQEEYRKDWKAVIGAWWDAVQLWGGKDLRKPTGVRGMVAQASWSASGSACLRFFFNPASRTKRVEIRNEAGEVMGERFDIPKQEDRSAALRHIKFVAPPPDRCFVYTDPDTHEKTGVFLFRNTANVECAELWFAEGDNTVGRVVNNNGETLSEEAYPWGGLLPIQQADIGFIFSPSVAELQGALDTLATSMLNNGIQHGYSQRTEINAEEDGVWSTVRPEGTIVPREREGTNGEKEYFWPSVPGLGGGAIRRLVGFPFDSGATDNPSQGFTTPAVGYHDPSGADNLIREIDAFTMMIRTACHQPHIRFGLLGGSSAEASGDAYEQARAAFVSDVTGVGEAVDAPLAPFLAAVTVAADWLAGSDTPVFLDEWNVRAQSHPNAGPPSSETLRSTKELRDGELLSREEAIGRIGVQDVPGEIARIRNDESLSAKERRWNIAIAAAGAGFDRSAVLEDLGFPKKRIPEFVRSDGPPNIEQ